MSNKPNRTARPVQFNPAARVDAITYEANGQTFTATFYPALNEVFPAITIQCKVPGGTAPDRLPMSRAWRVLSEIEGTVYAVLCVDFTQPVAPGGHIEGTQNGVFLADPQSGKILFQSFAPGQVDLDSAARRVLLENAFSEQAQPLPSGAMKTVLGEINFEDMTQTWTATLTAPSLDPYRINGDAQALRKSGSNPEKYSHFTAAWTWQTTGSEFAFLIAETADGRYHVIGYDQKGRQKFISTTAKDSGIGRALLSAESTAAAYVASLSGNVSGYVPMAPSPGRIRQPFNN